ncbi:MAG: TRAP transporter small permease [Verrucomicrobia bacterium]|nr:TRAP transporter small permease [Verrucomicrobiota bacterium]MDA1066939.1 TRAP transporter small permease [Verrucomicrobiota bacterium]
MKPIRNFLVKFLEVFLITAFAVLTLDVLWGVFSRYILNAQSRWTEELAIYLLIWVSLLGASLTYEEKGHLGVDYFVGKLHPDAQKLAAIFVELVVLFFAAFALLYGGWVLVSKTLASGQVVPALGWQKGYLYTAVPISGIFFIIFSIEHLLLLLAGKELPDESALEKGGDI